MADTFRGRFKMDGGLDFGPQTLRFLKIFIKKNPGMPFELKPIFPESKKQRGFFEGAVIPLWVYLDGNDYTSSKTLDQYREFSKIEFNPEIVVIGGKPRTMGGSTKRKLNQGFLERIIGYLEDNYGIDSSKVLDPKLYKHFKDKIYPQDLTHKYETFIDYLIDLKLLNRV